MRQKFVVSVFSAALAFAGLYSAWQWMRHASSGWWGCTIEANTSFGKNRQPQTLLSVHLVEPLSPASRAGLRQGDRVIALDGSSDTMLERIRVLRAGDKVRLRLEGEPPREATLTLVSPFSRPSVITGIILNALMGLIAFAIGAFVFSRRPGDVRALILFIVTAVYAVGRFGGAGPAYLYPLYLETSLLPVVVLAGCELVFFPTLLHFCLVFPARRPALERHPRLLVWIYGLPAACALFLSIIVLAAVYLRSVEPNTLIDLTAAKSLLGRIARFEVPIALLLLVASSLLLVRLVSGAVREAGERHWRRAFLDFPGRTVLILLLLPVAVACLLRLGSVAWRPLAGTAATALAVGYVAEMGAGFAFMSLVFPVAACVALRRSYRSSSGEAKRQLRWPLWGVSAGVGGYLLANLLISMVLRTSSVPTESLTNAVFAVVRTHLRDAALLLIPVSIAFGVLKHRLLDIDLYIRKTAIYGSLTGLLGIVYLVVVGVLGSLIAGFVRLPGHWVAIGSTLLVALLFVPVRDRVQRFMDRRFYRQTDYAAALRKLVARLSERRDRETVLRSAVESIQEALHARNVVLWLASRSEPAFRAEAKVGAQDIVAGQSIDKTGRLAQSLVLPGAPRWEWIDAGEADKLRAAKAAYLVPIRREQQLLGFLSLGTKLSDADYEQADVDFLESAAGQIAATLENLRFHEEQQEFERAREIQAALLPTRLPQLPGVALSASWQPARSVGGDYYDVLDLGASRLALTIADVSGKGITAALLMSNLQAAVKLLAFQVPDPRLVCEQVNQAICRNVTPGRFITFFYAVLDIAEGKLTYCNAGHNPPILDRKGQQPMRLEGGGPPLGLFVNARFEREEVALCPGDRLLLFTDGLSEEYNAAGQEFGEHRLLAILAGAESASVEELRDRVLGEVSDFCQGQFQDDATLLVVALEEAI
jgi:serine phosphatase RsbU (regulator of sigma subunit)